MAEQGRKRPTSERPPCLLPPAPDMEPIWLGAESGQQQTSALNRRSARLRFVMKAIDVCWRRGGRAVDEVARIAERVGKEGRPYHATKAGAQLSKGAIDIAIVLPPEVLQDFFP